MKIELKPQEAEFVCKGLELLIEEYNERKSSWIKEFGYTEDVHLLNEDIEMIRELYDEIDSEILFGDTTNLEVEEHPKFEGFSHLSGP